MKYPGPSRIPLPALPKVYCAGMANAETLNKASMLRWPTGRLPLLTQFGRSVAVMAAELLLALETGAARMAANHWPVYRSRCPIRSSPR